MIFFESLKDFFKSPYPLTILPMPIWKSVVLFLWKICFCTVWYNFYHFNTSRLSKSFCPSFLFHYTILFYYFNCGINILFSCPYSIVICSFYYSIKKRYFHQGGKQRSFYCWLAQLALCYCLVVNTNRNDCCNRFRDPKRIPDANRSEKPAE